MIKHIAAALALAIGLSAVSAPASADIHGRFFFGLHHHGGFHRHIFFGGPRIFFGPRIIYQPVRFFHPGPCYWLRVRAERTGDAYWWHQLQVCRAVHGYY